MRKICGYILISVAKIVCCISYLDRSQAKVVFVHLFARGVPNDADDDGVDVEVYVH